MFLMSWVNKPMFSSSENFSCKRYYVGETCETYNPCADDPCIKSECIVVNWDIFTLKKNILLFQIGDETEEGRAGEQQQAYQCLCNMEDGIEKCKSAFLSVDWKFIELRIFHTSEYTHFSCARWKLVLFFITFFLFICFPFQPSAVCTRRQATARTRIPVSTESVWPASTRWKRWGSSIYAAQRSANEDSGSLNSFFKNNFTPETCKLRNERMMERNNNWLWIPHENEAHFIITIFTNYHSFIHFCLFSDAFANLVFCLLSASRWPMPVTGICARTRLSVCPETHTIMS